jgi:hypothetical protein
MTKFKTLTLAALLSAMSDRLLARERVCVLAVNG